ncbi:MAG: hypothetical protein ACE5I1_13240 [bacterium]
MLTKGFHFLKATRLAQHIFPCFSALLLVLGCNGDPISITESQIPEIRNIFAPQKAFIDPADTLTVHVEVVDPQGVSDIAEVVLNGQLPDNADTFAFAMRDDGLDGDIIAQDGQYVVRFVGAIWERVGTGTISASAVDKSGNRVESEPQNIDIVAGTRGRRPTINSITFPDSVSVDSTFGVSLLANISDPDGVEIIDSVKYEIYPPTFAMPSTAGLLFDDGADDDGIAGNGVFGVSLTNTAIGIDKGIYTLRIQAIDQSGNESTPRVKNFLIVSTLDNLAPVVQTVSAPDTISRTSTGPFVLRAIIRDPNGLGDISRVFFNTFLPNGNPSSGNPFFMRDDGVKDENGLGDNVANDGEYALSIAISASNATGIYRFEFQAEDQAGLLSEKSVHSIVVVE